MIALVTKAIPIAIGITIASAKATAWIAIAIPVTGPITQPTTGIKPVINKMVIIGTEINNTKLTQNGHDKAIRTPGINCSIIANPARMAKFSTISANPVKIKAMKPKAMNQSKNPIIRNIGINATSTKKINTPPTNAINANTGQPTSKMKAIPAKVPRNPPMIQGNAAINTVNTPAPMIHATNANNSSAGSPNANNNNPRTLNVIATINPIKARIGIKIGNSPIVNATNAASATSATATTHRITGTTNPANATSAVTMIIGIHSKIPMTERTVTIAPATTAIIVNGIVIKLRIGIKLMTNPTKAAPIVKIKASGKINGDRRIPNVNKRIGSAVIANTTVNTTKAIGIQIGAVTNAIIGNRTASTGTAMIAKMMAAIKSLLSFCCTVLIFNASGMYFPSL